MMSTQFQVDTERIQAASGDIARISGEIEGQVSTMMARLVALQDAWTGSASTRFQGVVGEWQGTQGQVRAALDNIGTILAAAGAQYAETEAQTVRMFS
jgi:6 kDa early secretory antigenic target